MNRVDYVSRAVMIAENAPKENKKQLNQTDRKLLMACCEALQNPHKNIVRGKQKQIQQLIKKLSKEIAPLQQQSNCIVKFVRSFFKGLANFLNLRISSKKMEDRIHLSSEKLFTNPIIKEMTAALMQTKEISPESRKAAAKMIEQLTLLAHHTAHIKGLYNPNFIDNRRVADYLRMNTGYPVKKFTFDDLELIQKAPALLEARYLEAKQNNSLQNFFENAFSKNRTLIEQYVQLLNFGNPEWENEWKAKQPVVIPPQFIVPNNNIPMSDLDKYTAIMTQYEGFIEHQMRRYAEDLNEVSQEPWQQIKERLNLNPDFRQNYANDKNFEKYLIEANIVKNMTIEGEITRQDIKDNIQLLVNLEMLGRHVGRIDAFALDADPVATEIEDELADESKTNEMTKPFKEILEDWQQYSNDRSVKNTIFACYKLFVYKDELLPHLHERHFGYSSQVRNLVGAILHTEHPLLEIREFVVGAPKLLVEAHKAFKKRNKEQVFFDKLANQTGNPCLEGKLKELSDYMAHVLNASIEERLAPALVPMVDKTKTKTENFGVFITHFLDMQARKYAADKKIAIDEKWLEEGGKDTKTLHILNKDDFQKDYATVPNYIKYLKETAKVVDKETSNGSLTEQDVIDQANSAKDDLYMLEQYEAEKK